jgi:hypothetical protein
MICAFRRCTSVKSLEYDGSAVTSLSLQEQVPSNRTDQLHRRELPDPFTDRTVCRICRELADVEFATLRHQISVLASAIREYLSIDIANAEWRATS